MKKILFLISSLTGGGAERALCNVTLGMPDDVVIDILVNGESERDYLHKGRVISLNMPKKDKMTLGYQIKAAVKRIVVLRKLKKENGYDACISFMDSANMANLLSGRKKCRIILSERINLSECTSKGYRYIIHPFAKMLYPSADKVVALSRGVAADLAANFGVPESKLVTIYNGYDIALIKEKAGEISSVKLDDSKFHFISVGRFDEQKGQWHLIRAFSEVSRNYPECRLVLAGQGQYDEMYREMVRDYNLEDKVIFTGFVRNPFAIAVRCGAFVFPSLYEGFGNVIIENMACGLPIIATDFRSGAREILAPDTDYSIQQKEKIEFAKYGILTPVCSGRKSGKEEPLEKEEALLAQAMHCLIEDDDMRHKYRRQSIKRANDFSIEYTVAQWLALI